MALVTPIVSSIPAFDATVDTLISFVANGGDQVVKNEIKIILNNNESTETVVYQNTAVTFTLSQTVPADTLTNGVYYKVAFRTYDVLDNVSDWSNYQPFYCYSTPTLVFNISNNQTLAFQNYNLTLTYNQAQGEKLDYVLIQLYDVNGTLIGSSENLYSTDNPPIIFTYPLTNLVNDTHYKVVGTAVTVENTVVSTGEINFHVNYTIVENSSELYAHVNSCDGYINIKSAPVVNGNTGAVDYYPDPLTYIDDDTMLNLISPTADMDYPYSQWVKWTDFIGVSSEFLIRLWFYPARQPFGILKLSNDNGIEQLVVSMRRASNQDYISIRTTSGTIIDRGLGVFCNGNTRVFLWIKVVGSNWDVRTEVLEETPTSLNWNDNSNNNIQYNVTTDIRYGTEAYGNFIPSGDITYAISEELNILTICNGIFDELGLSLSINTPYSSNIPSSDRGAILTIHFNGSVNNSVTGNYTKMVLKHRDTSTSAWDVLKEMEIPNDSIRQMNYNDFFVPQGILQEYSLTLYEGTTPSDDYVISVMPKWGRIFLSDKDENYKLNYAVIYSNHNQNIQNGVLMPIGATYPIVIQNANGNYRSGSLQFKVLGYQFDIDKTLDRTSITKQTNDILKFLTNGKAKCIKDYNGNIFICRVINSPQISYDANWGNGITTISFDWVEQTKYNDYAGMKELGLIDNITE